MFTWFHFYAWALPILFIKSVSVSHSPALIYPMCVCVHVHNYVCVCVCVQNLSASEIIIFGYLSHVMRRRTPQSHIVNWKQLEGSLAWQGQCKICIPRVAPFCVEGEMQNFQTGSSCTNNSLHLCAQERNSII